MSTESDDEEVGKKSFWTIMLAPIIENGVLSIGRIVLLSCFILAMIQWAHKVDIGQSHLTILLTMIGYIFGSKVIGHAKDAIAQVTSIRAAIKDGMEGKVVADAPTDLQEPPIDRA